MKGFSDLELLCDGPGPDSAISYGLLETVERGKTSIDHDPDGDYYDDCRESFPAFRERAKGGKTGK